MVMLFINTSEDDGGGDGDDDDDAGGDDDGVGDAGGDNGDGGDYLVSPPATNRKVTSPTLAFPQACSHLCMMRIMMIYGINYN